MLPLLLMPLLALANYEGDLKKVHRLGDQADSILSKLGFEARGSVPPALATEDRVMDI